jgi:cardiolipin synthase
VLVPGEHLDSKLVRRASRHRWGKLLQNGVRIFEYQPTMFHRKVMIIDDLWVSVGSANFDNRSFRLNDEANLNVFDSEFALEENEAFEKDKQMSQEVTWELWKQRSIIQKVSDATVGLLRSQL